MDSPLHKISSTALRNLADSIYSGRLLPPFTPLTLQRYIPASERPGVAEELQFLCSGGLQNSQLAYILRLLAEARSTSEQTAERIELVWSGPEMPGAASRDTSVVVRELFSNAESSVLIAGFAVSHGSEIFRALAERMISVPTLAVRMFLNVSRDDDDGRVSNDEILETFYLTFKKKHWPWTKYPQVFYDPRALDTNFSKRAS